MSKLAIEIWQKHIDNFDQFDLVNNNGNDIDDETKSVSLFSALITLKEMLSVVKNNKMEDEIEKAEIYLYGSKYYSDANSDSSY